MRMLPGLGWVAWMAWAPAAPAGVDAAAVTPQRPDSALVAPAEDSAQARRATGGLKKPMLAPRPLSDDVYYDVSLGSASLSALLDWHPFGSGFRTTGGVMVNSHEGIGERVLPRGAYGLSPSYSVVALRRRTLNFYQPTPYLGVGWGRSMGRSHALNLSLDVGVMVQSAGAAQMAPASSGTQATLVSYLAA